VEYRIIVIYHQKLILLKIGDIDGKGIIYDDSGKLIYNKNEKKINEFNTKCKSWAAPYKRGIRKTHLSGIRGIHIEGRVIVTDQRVVFLGEPKHYHVGFDAIGIWGSSFGNYQYAMKKSNIAHEKGGKMYIEFPINKIKKITVGPYDSAIYSEIENKKIFKMLFDKEFGINLKKVLEI
jgi:hypothetical protein